MQSKVWQLVTMGQKTNRCGWELWKKWVSGPWLFFCPTLLFHNMLHYSEVVSTGKLIVHKSHIVCKLKWNIKWIYETYLHIWVIWVMTLRKRLTQIAWIVFLWSVWDADIPCCGAHSGRWSHRHNGPPLHPRPTSLQTCDIGPVHSSPRLSLILPSHSLHYKHTINTQHS